MSSVLESLHASARVVSEERTGFREAFGLRPACRRFPAQGKAGASSSKLAALQTLRELFVLSLQVRRFTVASDSLRQSRFSPLSSILVVLGLLACGLTERLAL